MAMMRKDEAEKIYRAIFRRDIPDAVAKRFNRSASQVESGSDSGELERYGRIINRGTDLAAMEYVSRMTGKNPLLVKKFQVMLYLGECMPENYDLFINEKRDLIKALLIFAAVPFNSVYKFLKGLFLLKFRIR